ncbi:sensor histidine kinase [Canicola haemoglobinophilus]|uniref:histidine kinase n=1 Tax=Canicola haemoglobinophilus TaxID=733 RepID=A0A1V4AZ06_9PAST|nr:PhnD/SsuA/transferrin family substrate-binding protein [Canicola haemoglobinophilus]OOR98054.1 sensor histidine kinase [Canicola haemoglobinophilus]STO53967.1 sensor kinase [Canicola haemoglobinophilus]STO60596.1 sensor kinase [Canicola haemoglobinophilus]STO68500.1 sensor kinase [Canicola haemoglobinophilus]
MKKCGHFLKIFILIIALLPSLAFSQHWKIGILAQRGITEAHERWQPWIDWLNQQFDESIQFSLVTLDLNDLETEQAQGVDFILSNQAQFFYLNNKDVRWLVTLKSSRQIQDDSAGIIGSAIFVRNESQFNQLKDLKNKRISAVGKKAFGGFLLGYNELYNQGLVENKDFNLVFTGFPVDNTLFLLEKKKVDAAIVPVCIFEQLVEEGKIKSENFRLLAGKNNNVGCLASTLLLPNWSLAAMPQVPTELASKLVTLLLNQVPNHLPQWTPPYLTNQTDEILHQLYKHPKQNLWQTIKYWFSQYQLVIISIALILLVNYGWINFQIHRKSKALQLAYQQHQQYEQQLIQADRLSILGEMTAGIAHEINQPLTAIRMYVEGIKYKNQNQQTQVVLDKILQQVDRSAEIIHNLMNWAKGKHNKNIESINLKHLLQKVTQFITLQHYNKCKINLVCAANIDVEIQATILEQILCNCLLNALQAQASIINVIVDKEQKELKIKILDNGTGFQQVELDFPFVPFRTSKTQGLGLGLVLCQRLIQAMNGDIKLANREDQSGAEVTLILQSKGK